MNKGMKYLSQDERNMHLFCVGHFYFGRVPLLSRHQRAEFSEVGAGGRPVFIGPPDLSMDGWCNVLL